MTRGVAAMLTMGGGGQTLVTARQTGAKPSKAFYGMTPHEIYKNIMKKLQFYFI